MRRSCAALALVLSVVGTVLVTPTSAVASVAASPTVSDQLGPDDVVRDVAAPAGAKLASFVRRDGDRVVADYSIDGVNTVLANDLSGNAGWVPVPGQESAGASTPHGIEGAAAGVVVAVHGVPTSTQLDDRTHVISSATGSWSVPGYGPATLSADGADVLIADGYTGSSGAVYDTATGRAVMDVPVGARQATVDAGQLWTIDDDGLIERRDLKTPGPPQTVVSAPRCDPYGSRSNYGFQVRGRWAVVQCSYLDASMATTDLVDLTGTLNAAATTQPGLEPPAALSDGALAIGYHAVTIRENAAQGPARQVSTTYPSTFADGSGPGFVYQDPTGGIRLLDPALQPAADDDVTAPSASITPTPAIVKVDTTLTLTWSGNDQPGPEGPGSGVYRYELNQSEYSRAPSIFTTPLAAGQMSITRQLINQGQECFRIRAVDRRANVGAWSPPTCTQADGTAPFVFNSGYPIALRPHGSDALVDVEYRFDSWPDQGGSTIERYETRYEQSSQSASIPGTWSAPHASLQRVRWATVKAGRRICFEGRAVDRVGNVSPWTRVICTVAPYDDSLLHLTGPSPTYHSSAAWGGRARTLIGSSSLSVVSGSAANCISVRALSESPGSSGRLEVYVAGRHRGTISPVHGSRIWTSYYPGDGNICGKGTFTIRHTGSAPVTVDAMTLYRPGDRGFELGRS